MENYHKYDFKYQFWNKMQPYGQNAVREYFLRYIPYARMCIYDTCILYGRKAVSLVVYNSVRLHAYASYGQMQYVNIS